MEEYNIFTLKKDLNKELPKGSMGTILLKHSEDEYEVEFINEEGTNIEYNGNATFCISKDFIELYKE